MNCVYKKRHYPFEYTHCIHIYIHLCAEYKVYTLYPHYIHICLLISSIKYPSHECRLQTLNICFCAITHWAGVLYYKRYSSHWYNSWRACSRFALSGKPAHFHFATVEQPRDKSTHSVHSAHTWFHAIVCLAIVLSCVHRAFTFIFFIVFIFISLIFGCCAQNSGPRNISFAIENRTSSSKYLTAHMYAVI